MKNSQAVVVFRVGEERYGLSLALVARVVRAVEVSRLPDAPSMVIGVIDLQGEVIPVLSIRRRLQKPDRPVCINDQFIIAKVGGCVAALVVEEVYGVYERGDPASTDCAGVASAPAYIEGVTRFDDGLVFIQNPEKFLSMGEMHALEQAMDQAP